jgi:hypothetical protein
MLPRQGYGIDFYGVYNDKIMVIVDLFTREIILTHLNKRNQDNVAQTLIKNIVFQRGVPRTLRTDNAEEVSFLTEAISYPYPQYSNSLRSTKLEQEGTTQG